MGLCDDKHGNNDSNIVSEQLSTLVFLSLFNSMNFSHICAEDVKLKAIEYCNNVQQSPDGWKLCLDKFFKSSHVEVKFFSLVVIQDTILHK